MTDPAVQPFEMGEGSTGVLLVHGFTGSPASMRPWGEYLANAGYRVRGPLLPGHGTRWQDLASVTWQQWYAEVLGGFTALRREVDQVFVAGLSAGGALALRLAAEQGEAIAGLVVVNATVRRPERPDAFVFSQVDRLGLLGLVTPVMPSVPGIINDIKKPGQDEHGYDKVAVKGAAQFFKLQNVVRSELPKVTQPLLVLSSLEDHVVEPVNSTIVVSEVSSPRRRFVQLKNSYHVATLDNDAEVIFEESKRFIEENAVPVSR
jgi:carboxylesterase